MCCPPLSGLNVEEKEREEKEQIKHKKQEKNPKNVKNVKKVKVSKKFGCKLCPQGQNCEIYLKMKNEYQFTKENYNHIVEFNHYNGNYEYKPICRYKEDCRAFRRMARMNVCVIEKNKNKNKNNNKHKNDKNANRLDCYRFEDQCHILIYRYPPRSDRSMKMQANMGSLITKTEMKFDDPDNEDSTCNDTSPKTSDHDYNESDEKLLKDLVMEVVNNDFERDLCLTDDDLYRQCYSIFKIVNEKLESKMHKIGFVNCLTRAEMLALILYTGCDCNYDLCKCQREDNFTKWRIFDKCLYSAISKLHDIERYDDVQKQIRLNLYILVLQMYNYKENICMYHIFQHMYQQHTLKMFHYNLLKIMVY